MTSDPPGAKTVQIDSDHSGQRIDNYLLSQLKGVSRNHVYKLLRSGQVRVNSGRKKPHYKLQDGDTVRIPPVRIAAEKTPAIPDDVMAVLENSILYENDDLLVLNKPPGIAVHSGSGLSFGVIEAMKSQRPDQFLELVHRLDRETSGCLVLAKNRPALTWLHDLLRAETLTPTDASSKLGKYYLALVQGNWPGETRIDTPLVKVKRGGEHMVEPAHEMATNTQTAVSHFKSLKVYRQASLMEINIETGRTHQIRVHAASAGHPVAGDEKYGDTIFNRNMKKAGLKRLFLHAARIDIPRSPGHNRSISIEAPLDKALAETLDQLEL